MNNIIKQVKESKDINFKDFLIATLYVTYFVGYTIGCIKRIIKELEK